MDNYDREMATINMVNRLNARNAAQAADNKELFVRQQIVRDLIVRGQSKPELLLLVLGDTETADNLVASSVSPHRIEWIANGGEDDGMTWERYVCMKIMAQRAVMETPRTNTPAPAEDETEDDLPAGFNGEEDNLKFPDDESEVTEE